MFVILIKRIINGVDICSIASVGDGIHIIPDLETALSILAATKASFQEVKDQANDAGKRLTPLEFDVFELVDYRRNLN